MSASNATSNSDPVDPPPEDRKKDKEEKDACAEDQVPLYALLSTAADACRRGCAVIRSVHAKRVKVAAGASASSGTPPPSSGDGEGDGDGGVISPSDEAETMTVEYKVSGDPRSALTEADGASQEVVLRCLRSRWGDRLNIIGEEDEDGSGGGIGAEEDKKKNGEKGEENKGGGDSDDDGGDVFARYGVPSPSAEPLREDLVSPSSAAAAAGGDEGDDGEPNSKRPKTSPPTYPLSELVVYVDPMDGTREFVEGRLGNVQCLIGVTYRGRPVGGIVGLPFASEARQGSAGGSGGGVAGEEKGGGSDVEVLYGADAESSTALGRLGAPSSAAAGGGEWSDLPFLPSAAEGEKSGAPAENGEATDSAAAAATAVEGDAGNGEKKGVELLVLSGDSAKPDLQAATSALNSVVSSSSSSSGRQHTINCVVAGGCGNKVLRVALSAAAGCVGATAESERNALAVVPRGTCSWDTAAPTALLRAALSVYGMKGNVTDFFGDDLVYDGTAENVLNNKGALLSSGSMAVEWHGELCGKLMEMGDKVYEKKS